jgi:hypothetical protein
MTDDDKLLADYDSEIHGEYTHLEPLTVAKLIESHRRLRQKNLEWFGAFSEAGRKGYEQGYSFGVKMAAEATIMIEDLRKMTIQELANLIGDENAF